MHKLVKAFTDSILDSIVDTEETQAKIVDFYGHPKVLYLGLDEQVIPEDIESIAKQAAEHGYNPPVAFMSSKPRVGINHKQYGVTSKGVNVYLDTALQDVLGIDPKKDSFTIKMTGGPDGMWRAMKSKFWFVNMATMSRLWASPIIPDVPKIPTARCMRNCFFDSSTWV